VWHSAFGLRKFNSRRITIRMHLRRVLLIGILALCSATADAKGGQGSGGQLSHSNTPHSMPRLNALGPGTGSKASSERVNGYTKKDGTHVTATANRRPTASSTTTGAPRGM
jgi:hypothetical protein